MFGAWIAFPRTGRCCWWATTAAATFPRTPSSSRWRSARTSASSGRSTSWRATFVAIYPALGWLRKFGTVAASHDNARLALESGAAVLVYPGGDYEVCRPSWQRHVVDLGGRKGFVRLAREAAVPIVPVASVSAARRRRCSSAAAKWLARVLMLDKVLRLKSVPISVALPWGVNITDWLGHIPLPAKIVIEVQEPIEVTDDDQTVYDEVVASLQAGVDRLAAERRFPVIG